MKGWSTPGPKGAVSADGGRVILGARDGSDKGGLEGDEAREVGGNFCGGLTAEGVIAKE